MFFFFVSSGSLCLDQSPASFSALCVVMEEETAATTLFVQAFQACALPPGKHWLILDVFGLGSHVRTVSPCHLCAQTHKGSLLLFLQLTVWRDAGLCAAANLCLWRLVHVCSVWIMGEFDRIDPSQLKSEWNILMIWLCVELCDLLDLYNIITVIWQHC